MFSLHDTARRVATEWPTVVGNLPKDLAATIGVFEEAGYAQGPNVGIDTAKLTVKNVEQAITDLAEAIAVEASFNDAQQRVRQVLARTILHAAGAAVPEVIAKVQPEFDAAVAEFAEAVNALPDDISSDALVNAGPDALAAYQRATEAAQVIAKIDGWLAGLVNLPTYAGRKSEPALRVLAPTNRHEFQILVDAHARTSPDRYLQRLNPLYVTAVREGIEFALHTPVEASEIRQRIESTPVERKPLGVATTAGFR